ncbi:hypothetical protein RQP53_15675 [Paucibacter sp. APW11]|uniref:Gingipain domain-containing protein n=1 Tax=Roseateles aquae TaxID=3077235 RepID=A0ABU3PDQ7_9BURK|nr:hypothetical protein [Paucibacter sp. APW11]MDT9000715.1 hypothetical protein [Paucibacter sp. APW11]
MDKAVVIHRAALKAKYGAAALGKIEATLAALVKADKKRGIDSMVIAVDQAATMKPYGLAVPAKPDARRLKAAIDAIAAKAAPHYWLLIGAPDVLPMVPLLNPAHGGGDGDGDKLVPSDLPYACEAPYSTDANRYLGPTRVLGRIPDMPGAKTPDLLLKLLRAAARSKPLPRSDYTQSFSLSAEVWQASTRLSVSNTFGHADQLNVAPPKGPKWAKQDLAPRMHFINCHGADCSPEYYGQHGEDYPVAHRASLLAGKISAGTVVAAECCYGAQLYDPAKAEGKAGIALAYLADGASGFFGSTTIAYGPSEGNGSADLICQYFLQRVLAGASLGRAALEARQKFAGERTHLDPIDLKTLAQFYLLGDPSLQPVGFEAHALSKTTAFKKAFASVQDRGVRGLRRERLEREGKHLARALPKLKASGQQASAKVEQSLQAMVKQSGLNKQDLQRLAFDIGSTGRRIHLLKGALQEIGALKRRVVIVATEENGELLHVRRVHSR